MTNHSLTITIIPDDRVVMLLQQMIQINDRNLCSQLIKQVLSVALMELKCEVYKTACSQFRADCRDACSAEILNINFIYRAIAGGDKG